MLRILSANVNGVRAAARRGGLQWIHEATPDVICLQEVRADDEQLAHELDEAGFSGWHVAHTEAADKGRAGVAVVSRTPLLDLRTDLPVFGARGCAGRWVEADIATSAGPLTVISAYVHTGERDTPRQLEKMRFLSGMTFRMGELGVDPGRLAVVTGDLNVAHAQADIKNWKGNLKKSGFLPEERAVIDTWLAGGWRDAHRDLAGEGPGPYTWWSWRGQAFDTDTGWRIDYQLATGALRRLARNASVGRAPTYAQRWSDHAAVVIDYELDAEPSVPPQA